MIDKLIILCNSAQLYVILTLNSVFNLLLVFLCDNFSQTRNTLLASSLSPLTKYMTSFFCSIISHYFVIIMLDNYYKHINQQMNIIYLLFYAYIVDVM